MTGATGFVVLLPAYHLVPACVHAIAGDCAGGDCHACANHRPPEGRHGEGLPRAEVDAFWDRRAALHPPVGAVFPAAWA